MITFGLMEEFLIPFYERHQDFAFGEKQVAIFHGGGAHRAFYFGSCSAQTNKLGLVFDAVANHIVHHPLVKGIFCSLIGESQMHGVGAVIAVDGTYETAERLVFVITPYFKLLL